MDFSQWLMKQMDRHEPPLSQSELARRLGLSRQSVNHLLSGLSNRPSIETLQKISETFEIPLGEVLRVAYDLPLDAVVETAWGVKMSKRLERFPPQFREIAEALIKKLEEMQKEEARNNGSK